MDSLEKILDWYKQFPCVKGIAVGGSSSAKTSDNKSDIDVYIFVNENISHQKRLKFVESISSKHEVGGEYFGSGDEFYVDSLEKQLDVMFWDTNWFENCIKNTWVNHYPSNGYTTCFLYTLNILQIIYDPNNWLEALKDLIATEYPEELQKNIIQRNLMLMKDKPFASYYEQIEKAIERNDLNSVNHRISAFLASYFDIIFAANKLLHPGEKRLLSYAKEHCSTLPNRFEENITNLLCSNTQIKLDILDTIVFELRKIL